MKNPLVSIIIPVYNGSNYLDRSIKSALDQSYKNIEIIVVNDGSKDGGLTEKLALSYGESIRYFSKPNGGVSSALNYGIQHMRGEFFSWLSHDDLYHAEKINIQVNKICERTDENIIVFCDSDIVNKRGNFIRTQKAFRRDFYEPKEMFEQLISGKSLNGCTLLIPKRFFSSVDIFDENLHYIQDWKLWLQFCLNDISFLKVKGVFVSMRVHEKQQTNKLQKLLPLEMDKVYSELIDKFELDPHSNFERIKLVIFSSYRLNIKSIRKRCWSILEKSNLLLFSVKFNLMLHSIIEVFKGRAIFIFRIIHKYFVFFHLLLQKVNRKNHLFKKFYACSSN